MKVLRIKGKHTQKYPFTHRICERLRLENNNGNCATYRKKKVEIRTIERNIFGKEPRFHRLKSIFRGFTKSQLNGESFYATHDFTNNY